MPRQARVSEDRIGRSVRMLISVLVRYPELGTVNYDPRRRRLKYTFLVRQNVAEPAFQALARRVQSSLEAFWYLEGTEPQHYESSYTPFKDVSTIEIVRDVQSLTPEEIALVIELVRGSFGEAVATDGADGLWEEDPFYQEELIEEMLEDLRRTRGEHNLIAFREEGRLVVFNK